MRSKQADNMQAVVDTSGPGTQLCKLRICNVYSPRFRFYTNEKSAYGLQHARPHSCMRVVFA